MSWRIIYRFDEEAIIVLDVFAKKTKTTPKQIIDTCKKRLEQFDNA